MIVDLAVAQQAEQPLDFFVADGAAQADAVDVGQRYEHGRVVGDDAEVIETAGGTENSFVFDALDDPETMIRVNDLVADFKCHESPCWKRSMEGRNQTGSSPSIAHFRAGDNEKGQQNRPFLPSRAKTVVYG